jgi:serine/threonine protein kinase
MMHNNFQPSSFTIGSDGNAKLRSFGAVDRSLDATVEAMQDDPRYAPPESLVDVFRFQAGRGAIESVSTGLAELEKQIAAKDFTNALREMDNLSKALDRFERAYGSDPDYSVKYKELRTQIEEIREEAKKSPQQADVLVRLTQKLHDDMKPVFDAHQKKHLETPLSYQASGKSDTWALGVAAYEMLTGKQFNAAQNLSQLEEAILNHANEGGLDEIPDPRGGNASGSGVGALGRLLNRVLSNDPKDRPSITDVLNHSLFLEPGVDSDEVRKLIKLMGNPSSTPAQLKSASDAIGV